MNFIIKLDVYLEDWMDYWLFWCDNIWNRSNDEWIDNNDNSMIVMIKRIINWDIDDIDDIYTYWVY